MDNFTPENKMLMRYLDKEMLPGEKAEFEKKLLLEPALQDEMENMQLVKEAVKSLGVKNRVASLHKEMMNELGKATPVRTISKLQRFIRYSVAVAASVLLIFLGLEGYNFYKLSPNRLFAENFTDYELSTTRSGTDKPESNIEKAYREKKYNEIIRLNAISVLSAKDIFLTGLAYLKINDPSKAITNFQVVLADLGNENSSTLKDESEYYLALAYLKNTDFDQAIELMNKIHSNPAHLYTGKFSRKFIRNVKMLKWR